MPAIDTSSWNGHPDFGQVKASGVTLVIGKASDGELGRLTHDSVYAANRDAARAAGLRVGAYFFNGPVDPTAAADDLFAISDYRPGDVLAIDVENFAGQVGDFVDDRRGRENQVHVVFALEALLHDVHVEKTKEADAETKA